MANGYFGSADIRELEKLMRNMCQRKGYDFDTAFCGFLDYLLWQFDVEQINMKPDEPRPAPDAWRFDAEDAQMFTEMACAYFSIMQIKLKDGGWYDAFGDLYMALHSNGGGKGQFFTPPELCDVLARLNLKDDDDLLEHPHTFTTFGRRLVASDAACGSSRLLLAADSVLLRKMTNEKQWQGAMIAEHRPYLIGEDLDYNCVKMSAINMMMHGCFGEVICHNSIEDPGEVRLAYIVNETMWPLPTNVPCIRRVSNPKKLVLTSHWLKEKELQEEKQPQQLELF